MIILLFYESKDSLKSSLKDKIYLQGVLVLIFPWEDNILGLAYHSWYLSDLFVEDKAGNHQISTHSIRLRKVIVESAAPGDIASEKS